MNGTSSKIPTTPPLPLPRHFPQRGQQGKLGSPMGELSSKARLRGCCSLNGTSPKLPTTPPLPLTRHFPQRGQQGPRLPGGGAVEQSETEGVWFVEWHQPKVTDYTPFAAAAARNRGMIATGNHCILIRCAEHHPQRGQREGAAFGDRWKKLYFYPIS